IELCKKSISLNKLKGQVETIIGDASKIIEERLVDKGDRILMLLPERSDEFLGSTIKATKSRGIIHYYSHQHANKRQDAIELSKQHFLQVTPVKSEIIGGRMVRPVGPHYYQTVVDVKILK
ncbi:MAG: class I SAM-dependent methyltransferase family protein, partial [Nitrosopumilaceae archaeon]